MRIRALAPLVVAILTAVPLSGCAWLFPGAKAGDPAPDFDLTDLEGGRHNLSAYAGRVLVLDFMASSCGPCRLQMPHLKELHDGRNVSILSVAIDPTEKNHTLAAFRDEFEAKWPFAIGDWFGIREDYGILTLPKIVVIDREARIAYASEPGTAADPDELSRAVDEALA